MASSIYLLNCILKIFFFQFVPFDLSKSFTYLSPPDGKLLKDQDLCLISTACNLQRHPGCPVHEQPAGEHSTIRAEEKETSRDASDMAETQGEG